MAGPQQQPQSLGDHVVPEERLAVVLPHVAALAATALTVNDTLPLEADVADFIAVLEAEAV